MYLVLVFSPLLSFIISLCLGKYLTSKGVAFVANLCIFFSLFSSFLAFYEVGLCRSPVYIKFSFWIDCELLDVSWGFLFDSLSVAMCVLVTCISLLVHLYSTSYMSHDPHQPRFISYLSLFTFFMLALVSADNFLQLFFGWEGVGLCSYLLIGYYYQKDSANNAAVKAFIVNRIGDFAFIMGIVITLIYASTVEFSGVFRQSQDLANTAITILGYEFKVLDIICLMLFIGCTGKSAQIGMHVWLPDAMEGPTPVSALIHAATMVTAGVFLIARCSFMFEYSPNVLAIITVVGAITCLFAATIAIAQTDIKKIIAYSTCSQLGYMFFACGVSAYQAGIFHLVTHGFFKALLFLSAGSVIHSTSEQEIFKIGGIWQKMPITYANFWVGSLAIIGIFPLAGFYSKDLILESAYIASGVGVFAFVLGIFAALLTAIYSLKIIMVTFHGNTSLSKDVFSHVHESPKIMNTPLLVLVAGALFSGMLGYYILSIDSPLGYFSGSIFNLHTAPHDHHVSLFIQLLPLMVGVTGSIIGIYCYRGNTYQKISNNLSLIYCVLKNKYFFDELYDKIFIKFTKVLSCLAGYFDIKVIDRFGPNGFAHLTRGISWCICGFQTGYIVNYVLYIIFTLVLCITIFVFKYLPVAWSA